MIFSVSCPNCGYSCSGDATFCVSCGASVAVTGTTRLLRSRRILRAWRGWRRRMWPWASQGQAAPLRRRTLGELLTIIWVAVFGMALLGLVLSAAYGGTAPRGISAAAWLFVLAAGIHLVRGVRHGEALRGMRWAVLCAAIPFAIITQDFITTTVLFGAAYATLSITQFVVACVPRRRWRRGRP
jgi:hypothetical protein